MKTDYEVFASTAKGRRLLRQEDLILEVLEGFSGALAVEDISKTDLAKRLGKTKGFVSQILSGGRNLTLRTIADVCWALGYAPHFELKRERRSLGAISVQNTVQAVDWDTQGMEMKDGKAGVQGPDASMAANQELAVAA